MTEMTTTSAVGILGKIVAATAAKGAGITTGSLKALASKAIEAGEGTYTRDCLSHNTKTHYVRSDINAFNYVSDLLTTETLKKDEKNTLA